MHTFLRPTALCDTILKSFVPKNLATSSMTCGPGALTSPGSLLETQTLRPHSHPTKSEPTL